MKKFLRESFRSAFPLFLSLSLSILFFFIIFRYHGLGIGISRLVAILRPFIYGGVLAYLLKTPYNWIEGKMEKLLPPKRAGLVKPLSVLIVMVLAFAVIYTLLAMVIPALVNSIIRIINTVPSALNEFQKFISKYTEGNEVVQNYIDQATNAVQTNGMSWVKEHILPRLQKMMGEFANTFSAVAGVLYNVVIGIIICVYLLLSKHVFARQGKMLVYAVLPKDWAHEILKEFAFIDKTFVGFFAGKILDSAIVGLICYIFCLILQVTMGVQNAILIAVIVGVTNIIPYFGPYIGAIPSALLVLIDSPMACVIFVVFILILQQFDGNVLGPKLLSESVGLSGFWVLFSITFFGGLWGFVGILVGVPVFAVIYDLVKRWVYHMLDKKKIKVSEIPSYASGGPGDGDNDPVTAIKEKVESTVQELSGLQN